VREVDVMDRKFEVLLYSTSCSGPQAKRTVVYVRGDYSCDQKES
jgi:hypothetical protein